MTREPSSRRSFALGRAVITRGALAALDTNDVLRALARHASGDWGDVSGDDWIANDESLGAGERLLSSYRASDGRQFWINTESDRSATIVLLPEEY